MTKALPWIHKLVLKNNILVECNGTLQGTFMDEWHLDDHVTCLLQHYSLPNTHLDRYLTPPPHHYQNAQCSGAADGQGQENAAPINRPPPAPPHAPPLPLESHSVAAAAAGWGGRPGPHSSPPTLISRVSSCEQKVTSATCTNKKARLVRSG